MMVEQSWPFAGGGNVAVQESEWSRMARQWSFSGVAGDASKGGLAVTADTGTRSVKVAPGVGCARGFWFSSDADKVLSFAANASGQPRIDRVVLRADPSADSVVFAVVQGSPGGNPVAPSLTQTDTGIWETPLAAVLIPAGATAVSTITDERAFTGPPLAVGPTTALPVSPTPGQAFYDTTAKRLQVWTGVKWQTIADGPPAGYSYRSTDKSEDTVWVWRGPESKSTMALQLVQRNTLGESEIQDWRFRVIGDPGLAGQWYKDVAWRPSSTSRPGNFGGLNVAAMTCGPNSIFMQWTFNRVLLAVDGSYIGNIVTDGGSASRLKTVHAGRTDAADRRRRFFDAVQVVDFTYRDVEEVPGPSRGTRHVGFIAEQVAEAQEQAALDGDVVSRDENGDPYSLNDRDMLAVLWSVVQEQEARIKALEADNG